MALDRMCSSGMIAIADAAKTIMVGKSDVIVAGGLETISLVQNKFKNSHRSVSQAAVAAEPAAYVPMIRNCRNRLAAFNISRAARWICPAKPAALCCSSGAAGKFDEEIVPMTVEKQLFDKEGNPTEKETVTLAKDEGARADAKHWRACRR